MGVIGHILNTVVATFFGVAAAFAGEAELDALFERLAQPDLGDWEQVEQEIWKEWSRSGSDSMDLLLDRGRKAMSAGDLETALDHFSALIDHAPDFAEGWNARATAYFAIKRFGLSIADIERTLALNPRHFGALQGLGRILEELEDTENALGAYKAALAIHPHRPALQDTVDRLERRVTGQEL